MFSYMYTKTRVRVVSIFSSNVIPDDTLSHRSVVMHKEKKKYDKNFYHPYSEIIIELITSMVMIL